MNYVLKKYKNNKFFIIKKKYNFNDPYNYILKKKNFKNLNIFKENIFFNATDITRYENLFINLKSFNLFNKIFFYFKKEILLLKILKIKYFENFFIGKLEKNKKINLFFLDSLSLNNYLKKKNIIIIEQFISFFSLLFFKNKKEI